MKRINILLFPLLLIGFLWGCETTDPLVSEMETNLFLGNYETVYEAADEALEADSSNSLAYFYRAVAYGFEAQDTDPSWERVPLYENSREAFMNSREWMNRAEERPGEYEEINDYITSFWAEEHNAAIGYLTDDSVRATVNEPVRYAIGHLESATTIQPDSALSYIVLASTQFNQGDTPQAIETYEMAMERMDVPEQDDYEFLISLYLNQEQYDKAFDMTQRAREDYPENTQFVQFLADVYIQRGDVDEAISIIESLIETDPDNPQYYRVLGTQIYQNVSAINSQVAELYNQAFDLEREIRSLSGDEREEAEEELRDVRNQIDELQNESSQLTEIAVNNMEKVVELLPEDDDAYNILGIIYQNKAANLFEQRNSIVDDNEMVQELDDQAREALQQARQYYERAAEINPDVPEYWESLFQVYTTLGMEEEAREAMEKAGM
ncbi:tetratricopeptide repeat protein [Rhodohalobacter sp. 8-1]|uniref:tetratricopeptide repeat protein n=1 Tax=Rhodohalobacter sp. 8-1 TaxID=3131972 RepID=UPI0030EBA9AE